MLRTLKPVVTGFKFGAGVVFGLIAANELVKTVAANAKDKQEETTTES